MSNSDVIQTLLNNHQYLHINSIWMDGIRTICWLFILGLAQALNALSSALNQVYQVMDFFNSRQVTDLLTTYMPVIFAMATLALAYLGWKIMIVHSNDYNKLITNALVAVTLFVALPWCMTQAEHLVLAGKKALNRHTKLSTNVINNNMTDVYLLDKAHFHAKNLRKHNHITDQNMYYLDITETVDTGNDVFSQSQLSPYGTKVLSHKLNNINGQNTLVPLKKNWIMPDEAYYRYAWHPVYMIVELLTLLLVFCFTIFKTAQLIMELGLLKVLAQGTVFTDLENGQRNKKLVEKIRNTFVILYIVMLLLEFYTMFTDYVSKTHESPIVKLIIIVAAAFLVIDGPNIIEELFGIDAGLKSASRSLMGMFAAGQMAKDGGKAVGNVAKKGGQIAKYTGGKVMNAGGAVTGAGKGALAGFKEKGKGQMPGNGGKPKPPGGTGGIRGGASTVMSSAGSMPLGSSSNAIGSPIAGEGASGKSSVVGNQQGGSSNAGGAGQTLADMVHQSPSYSASEGMVSGPALAGTEGSASAGAGASGGIGVVGKVGNQKSGMSPAGQGQGAQSSTSSRRPSSPMRNLPSGSGKKGISSNVGKGTQRILSGVSKPSALHQPKRVSFPPHIQAKLDQHPLHTERKPTTTNTFGQEAIQRYADTAQKIHDKVQETQPAKNYNQFYDLTKNTILKNDNGKGAE